jgi:hypothetical protein
LKESPVFKQQLSGQSVAVLPGLTFKWGPGGKAQGDHMYKIECDARISHLTPKIYMAFGNVYVMQTLRKIKVWDWREAAARLEVLWGIPEQELLPSMPMFDTRDLERFINEYGPPFEFKKTMTPMQFIEIVYRRSNEMTHGDPTAQNTMLGPDGGYTFIDWQWHRRAFLPASRDVDYGKLLQAIISNEELQFAMELLRVAPSAWFWCAIHFMRIANRDPLRRPWCDRQIEKCVWVHNRRKTNYVA